MLLLLLVLAVFRKELSYGLMQAKGQLMILREARPIDYYLTASNFPDSLKQKLPLLAQIKTYAADSLGLPAANQYNKLYDQKGQDVLWVVTAAERFSLINYQWNFPLLGEVSYKGFFVYAKALETAKKLDDNGFDTRIRPVGAWSTLGWFDDPLMSRLLERSEAKLAEVIFHELVHDVVYIKDSTDFNENLATFISREMTVRYLIDLQRPEAEITCYKKQLSDAQMLNRFVNRQLLSFDSLYAASRHLNISQRQHLKRNGFAKFKSKLSAVAFETEGYSQFLLQNDSLNNANLLAFDRYGGIQDELASQYKNKFGRDVLKMLAYYEANFSSL